MTIIRMNKIMTLDKMTPDVAYEQDVRTMSYDELMDTIRFLDKEREEIKKSVENKRRQRYSHKEVQKRVA